VKLHDHGLDDPTVSRRRQVRIGGWVDLTVVDADGARELRQLDFWGGRAPVSDPMELDAVRVAVLRLSQWCGDDPLRVIWADLVHGVVRERAVDVAGELAVLRDWFDGRLETIRRRAADAEVTAGDDCGGCKFVSACPQHPRGANYGRRRDHLPGIVTLTPTSLGAWRRCPREWHDRYVLQVPASDGDPSPSHGQQLHAMLGHIHDTGSCRDPAHVDDVLAAHGLDADERTRAEIANHVRRHDGVLDARDYKTGRVWSDVVAHDEQARLQAFVLAPRAAAAGLRLRITFEHLAPEVPDDPAPFEPDDDDITAIEEELRVVVAEIRNEQFDGVGDADVCVHCQYRSVCPDSAAPSEPIWPAVAHEDAG
jgi:hypothetical protein